MPVPKFDKKWDNDRLLREHENAFWWMNEAFTKKEMEDWKKLYQKTGKEILRRMK
ncbi:hypothetical protein phiOC_p334 [Ochrobactrum phage vB_OspM_OC]|nr:hypothetical protein phiOC_p334 [Ochrobactrum phage vB_OspM_OC]